MVTAHNLAPKIHTALFVAKDANSLTLGHGLMNITACQPPVHFQITMLLASSCKSTGTIVATHTLPEFLSYASILALIPTGRMIFCRNLVHCTRHTNWDLAGIEFVFRARYTHSSIALVLKTIQLNHPTTRVIFLH